jgi:transcriptional regulator
MYVRPVFEMDRDEAVKLLRERAFGLLAVPAAGAPAAVHVPFLVTERSGESIRIECHIARANPLHNLVGSGCKALLICSGPDAYISPDWYGSSNQVPTWTYAAVHVTGTACILAESSLLGHVDRLSAQFEARLAPKKPWTSAKMDEARRSAMLGAIVGIAIDVEEIAGSKKFVQHKPEAEQAGAIAGLRARDDPASQAIAKFMEEARQLHPKS